VGYLPLAWGCKDMKKFIVIMSFVLIIIIFVGLNYLLWERENREKDIRGLQEASTSGNLTINALNRQLENLENTLKLRNDNIDKITNENNALRKDIEELKQENIRLNNMIRHKAEVINSVYKDIQQGGPIETSIKKWAEYISSANYKEAYSIWYGNGKEAEESLDQFTNKYKNIVNSIKIKSITPYNIDTNAGKNMDKDNIDRKIIDEYDKGDVFLLVELDVKLAEWAVKYDLLFNQGENKKIIVLSYNAKDKKWYISDIRNP